MKLSLKAIELCRMKYDKGIFCGFEWVDNSILCNISEAESRLYFDELLQNKIIDFSDDNMHISALGQHIFNMMLKPEQYIILDNIVEGKCVRIYIRNAYYLCIIEDRTLKSDDGYNSYTFKLLPRFEFVVGSFVYALHHNEKNLSVRINDDKQAEQDIKIVGRAWNKNREFLSEISMYANYYEENIHCQMVKEVEGLERKLDEFENETSELINKLTIWVLKQISTINEGEVR